MKDRGAISARSPGPGLPPLDRLEGDRRAQAAATPIPDLPYGDPKPPPRLRDRDALAAARLAGDECAACGGIPGSVHHVVPRSEGGDDIAANLILLCGSGTTGDHGAWHGSPYVHAGVRRDAEWVARRIGQHLALRRPDVIAYVLEKLGDGSGRDYLGRRYYLGPDALV